MISGGKLTFDKSRMPPRLSVDYGHALTTKDRQLKLAGKAGDDARIRDIYVFVGARKVFYLSNGGKETKALSFATQVPLEPGIN